MTEEITRQKPLIQWMDQGDSDLMPVLMADPRSAAASYFGIHPRKEGTVDSFIEETNSAITPELAKQFSRETGIHVQHNIGFPARRHLAPFDLIEFIEDIEVDQHEEQYEAGRRRFTTIRTPHGDLSEVFSTPTNQPSMWDDHFINSEDDLPAWSYLIETAAETALSNSQVAEKVTARLAAEAQRWAGDIILYGILGAPTFELTSNLYIDPTLAFYLLADHPSKMERMFEVQESVSPLWVRCLAEAGADFVLHALNGLEIFSPTIYEKYFVPQTRRLHDAAHALGLRTWVHTCGFMNRLIDMGIYEEMRVDVQESFSHPPLGDVADLRATRAKLGPGIVTRGAVNVDLFYDSDLQNIRDRVHQVVADTRGYRHMMGDTNDSFPPYPRENILAVVDELDKLGVLLPA